MNTKTQDNEAMAQAEQPIHPSVEFAFERLMKAADWISMDCDSDAERIANTQTFTIPAYRLRDWYFTQEAMHAKAINEARMIINDLLYMSQKAHPYVTSDIVRAELGTEIVKADNYLKGR